MPAGLPPTERGELGAFSDLWAAAPEDVVEQLGIAQREIGGAFAFSCDAAPIREFNRVIGITAVEELDGAERFFRELGRAYWISLLPGTGLEDELARRGYEPDYAWMKFSRTADDPPSAPTELELVEVGADRALDFAVTACGGYGLEDAFVPWVAQLPGRDGWLCVVAYDSDRSVGTGALVVEGDLGWLGFGATLAEARGRGSQSAILAHRIRRAGELGCGVVVTETGERTEGRESGSYRNILRAGFEEVYVRPNLRAPDPGRG